MYISPTDSFIMPHAPFSRNATFPRKHLHSYNTSFTTFPCKRLHSCNTLFTTFSHNASMSSTTSFTGHARDGLLYYGHPEHNPTSCTISLYPLLYDRSTLNSVIGWESLKKLLVYNSGGSNPPAYSFSYLCLPATPQHTHTK